MSHHPELNETEIIRRLIEFRIADVHTAMPGTIIAFDAVRNMVTVQPDLSRVFVDLRGVETITPAPVLKEVPVKFLRGGGFRITWDLSPGDEVLLVFCERSIDTWSQIGGSVDPTPRRKHDWSDAIAIPGMSTQNNLIEDIAPGQMVLGAETGNVEIRIDRLTATITVKAPALELGAAGGPAVGRVGDEVTIDQASDPTFFAWLAALSPTSVAPYTQPIKARITSGSPRVTSG